MNKAGEAMAALIKKYFAYLYDETLSAITQQYGHAPYGSIARSDTLTGFTQWYMRTR